MWRRCITKQRPAGPAATTASPQPAGLEKTWEEYQEIEKVFHHLMDGGRAMPHNPAIRAYCRQVRRGLELPGRRHLLRGSGA